MTRLSRRELSPAKSREAKGDDDNAKVTHTGMFDPSNHITAPKEPRSSTLRPLPVDMQSHGGLRGVAAVWIVIFHCFGDPRYHAGWVVALQGSSLMPLFFMLSGFSLAVTYGRTTWAVSSFTWPWGGKNEQQVASSWSQSHSICVVTGMDRMEQGNELPETTAVATSVPACSDPPTPLQPFFPTRDFYQNRIARVIPVYWLSILISIPLWLLNIADYPFSLQTFLPSLATSIIPLTSLFSAWNEHYIAAINPVGWFITTLAFFWLFFPVWLPRMQRLSDRALLGVVVGGYWLQLFLIQSLYSVLPLFFHFRPFTTATMNPLSRFPLFLMGMAAGLLSLRHASTEKIPGGPHRTPPTPQAGCATHSYNPLACSEGQHPGRKGSEIIKSPVRSQEKANVQMRPPPGPLTGDTLTADGLFPTGFYSIVKAENGPVETSPEKGDSTVFPWPACVLCLPLPTPCAASCPPVKDHPPSPSRPPRGSTQRSERAPPPPLPTDRGIPSSISSFPLAHVCDEPSPRPSPGPSLLPSLPELLLLHWTPPSTPKGWALAASQHALALLLCTLLVAGIDTGYRIVTQGRHTIGAQVWYQGVVVMAQLNVVLALTRDEGRSHAARFLRIPVCAWLGRISMNLYLLHYPLLGYLALALHPSHVPALLRCFHLGRGGKEGDMEAEVEAERVVRCQALIKDVRVLPWWSVLIVVPVAIGLAEGVGRWVEAPARQAWRRGKGRG